MLSTEQDYVQLETQYDSLRQKEAKNANIVATFRLVTILSLLAGSYIYFNAQNWVALASTIGILGLVFGVLVFVHAHIKERETLFSYLTQINRDEQAYLNGDLSAFDNGEAFINPEHPYTFDLDMFGNQSIFQHLNRTVTLYGRSELAENLSQPSSDAILLRQNAIDELSQKVVWRQHFQAQGLMFADKNEHVSKFKNWLEKPSDWQNQKIVKVFAYILPAITILVLLLDFMTDWSWTSPAFKALGMLNLILVANQQKRIKQEHELLSNMSLTLQKYSVLLKSIENQTFKSEKLVQLKQSIVIEGASASQAMKQLSVILNQFDNILNPVAAIISNGLFQYHVHALFSLDKWKRTFGQNVSQWFKVIGEFEALSSIANFAYNHPDFVYPTPLNAQNIPDVSGQVEGGLLMKNIGHPLIPKDKRIGNDMTFNDPSFIVLTGSNMSGKSTFLRTLGVNLVLAKMGSPVCADEFQFYPFNVFVSMRVSDSLQNSESFFFAELKRLKRIITELEQNQKTFVILDEILRGTNSNDKRAGTIGLIKNLMTHRAVGIIATHDLVIGDMKNEFPNYLENKCFEVEIRENDLFFDYKLQNGVAQKMSAAFLMTKMGIIR